MNMEALKNITPDDEAKWKICPNIKKKQREYSILSLFKMQIQTKRIIV